MKGNIIATVYFYYPEEVVYFTDEIKFLKFVKDAFNYRGIFAFEVIILNKVLRKKFYHIYENEFG